MSEPEKRDTDITLPDVDNAPLGSQSSTKENDAPLDLSAEQIDAKLFEAAPRNVTDGAARPGAAPSAERSALERP